MNVTSDTIYGAMAAMETFSQLFVTGGVACSHLNVTDYPNYPHRGFLVDSGRRFAPVPLLQNLIDSMSYSKVRRRVGGCGGTRHGVYLCKLSPLCVS